MNHTTAPEPKVVRDLVIIVADQILHEADPDGAVAVLVKEVHERALATAALIGITRPSVTSSWDLHFTCSFADYPMRLLGPGAPQIKTWRDCFRHDYRDNPQARYAVVIRDQDEEDASLAAWKAEQVQRAAVKPTTITALPPQPIQPLRGHRRIGVMLDDGPLIPLDTGDAAVQDSTLP